MTHYVCDLCGNYWQAYRSDECPACKHDAIWGYVRETPAREHAAQIAARVEVVVRDPESWQAVADAGRRAK